MSYIPYIIGAVIALYAFHRIGVAIQIAEKAIERADLAMRTIDYHLETGLDYQSADELSKFIAGAALPVNPISGVPCVVLQMPKRGDA